MWGGWLWIATRSQTPAAKRLGRACWRERQRAAKGVTSPRKRSVPRHRYSRIISIDSQASLGRPPGSQIGAEGLSTSLRGSRWNGERLACSRGDGDGVAYRYPLPETLMRNAAALTMAVFLLTKPFPAGAQTQQIRPERETVLQQLT